MMRSRPFLFGAAALVAVAGILALTAAAADEDEDVVEIDDDERENPKPEASDASAGAPPSVPPGTKVVGITIPQGAVAGQQIVIQLKNGKKIGVQVPEGAVAGQQLQVGIPEELINAPREEGEDDEEDDDMSLPAEAAQLFQASRKLMEGGRLKDAELLMKKALEVTEEEKGPAHPIVGLLTGQLGILLKAAEKFDAAEMYLRRALVSELAIHGDASVECAPMMGQLAGVLEEQGRFTDALGLYQKCYELRAASYGDGPHEAVASSLCALAGCQKNVGKITAAEANYVRAKNMCVEKLGADHESVSIISKTLTTFPKLKELARVGLFVDGEEVNKADSPWSPIPNTGETAAALELVAADPFTAHEASGLANAAGSVEGKVVLVLRGGGSTFAEKVNRAHEAGAVAVLVVSNDEAHPKSVFQMGSGEGYVGPVPAVMIGNEDGMALKKKLEEEGAGPVVVEFREREYQETEADETEDGVLVPEVATGAAEAPSSSSNTDAVEELE
jgi:tetratricopeptide (TPR) repeat protein